MYMYQFVTSSASPMYFEMIHLRNNQPHVNYMYSGPCILRPPILPVKYGLKLKVVLK